ncbi:MAG: hypothetical protein M0Z54_01785 [Thermaerobacter sp.]|nr:hypothetical protein [Thermaerobacter sp.]
MYGTDSRPGPQPARQATHRGREVTLMARFDRPEQAERAAQALRAAGFDIVQLADGAPGGPEPVGAPLVEWGRYGYQMGALDDKWTTAAAWENPLGLTLGSGTLLTAVVPSADRQRAAQVIEAAGGRL